MHSFNRVRYQWRNSIWEERRTAFTSGNNYELNFTRDNRLGFIGGQRTLLYASFPARFYRDGFPVRRCEIDVFSDLRR